ncbi:MAG: permease [Rhodovibrio sp.]|nr:permease [Rhodovibrio sp.]
MFIVFEQLADLVAFRLLGLVEGTRLADAVHFFVEDVSKIFVLLVAVIFLVGLFRSVLTPERVRGYLSGRSRGATYGMAVGLGAVTPFCSCSSVPLFIGFLKSGVPMGATMAFLVASPMINEVAVVVLAGVVGWELALLYIATGLAVGMLGGWLTDRFHLERFVQDFVWQVRTGQSAESVPDTSLAGRVRFAWSEVRDIVGRIWIYVLIGIGIGAGLHGFVPQEVFAKYASADNLLAVPAAVLAGIPLYANATGVIPVVEALLGKGVPIGTALVLMMSVVALSLPEFIMLRQVITVRGLAAFAGFMATAFIAVGYLFNAIL